MTIKRKHHKKHHKAKRKTKVRISLKRRKVLNRKAKKLAFSMQAPLKAYHDLERKIDKTWNKLRVDVKNRSRRAIIKGRRDLLLLLGECNYMARECSRCLMAGKHR